MRILKATLMLLFPALTKAFASTSSQLWKKNIMSSVSSLQRSSSSSGSPLHNSNPKIESNFDPEQVNMIQVQSGAGWTVPEIPFMSPRLQQSISANFFDDQVLLQVRNLAAIARVPQGKILQSLWMKSREIQLLDKKYFAYTFSDWSSINSPADLYLPDLGEFDVHAAYTACIQRNKMRHYHDYFHFILPESFHQNDLVKLYVKSTGDETVDASDMDRSDLVHSIAGNCPEPVYLNHLSKTSKTKFRDHAFSDLHWYASIRELQIEGYFGEHLQDKERSLALWDCLYQIMDAKSHPVRQHLVRYRTEWCQPENLSAVDELQSVYFATRDESGYEAAGWPENWETLNPKQLISAIRQVKWHFTPSTNPTPYKHIASLKDHGRMRVVKSDDEYETVKKALSLGYNSFVEPDDNKQDELDIIGEASLQHPRGAILVTLQDEHDSEKPIAAGMLRWQNEDSFKLNPKWDIQYQPGRLAARTKQRFEEYKRTIMEDWANSEERSGDFGL